VCPATAFKNGFKNRFEIAVFSSYLVAVSENWFQKIGSQGMISGKYCFPQIVPSVIAYVGLAVQEGLIFLRN
jgi:hypothetical protein